MKKINITEVEQISCSLERELATLGESIPSFLSRYPGKLESCLAVPFQAFGGEELYKGLLKKGAALFYMMLKDHPFEDGNKRIALASLLVFIYRNKKWLKVDNQELYNFVIWVTESNPKLKDETLEAIEEFLKSYLVDL